jgi:hypothetical protein
VFPRPVVGYMPGARAFWMGESRYKRPVGDKLAKNGLLRVLAPSDRRPGDCPCAAEKSTPKCGPLGENQCNDQRYHATMFVFRA